MSFEGLDFGVSWCHLTNVRGETVLSNSQYKEKITERTVFLPLVASKNKTKTPKNDVIIDVIIGIGPGSQ